MRYSTINIQGNLFTEDLLLKIESGEADGQAARDFGLEDRAGLREAIEQTWSEVRKDWTYFRDKMDRLAESDPYGTTLSRRWMETFLGNLGFELELQRRALPGDNGAHYTISHTVPPLDALPVHIVGFRQTEGGEKNTLDVRGFAGQSRYSPQGLLQEYLNVTEHVYGLVTNGYYLRLIRDSARLVKLSYVEFDLRRMLDEDLYSEFVLLYRLLHASRFPRQRTEVQEAWLEQYYQSSIESGNRIRDGLSKAVRQSLSDLGTGFLRHEANDALRTAIRDEQLSPKDFYRQLMRVVYRLLFLMVTEERDLVYDPDESDGQALRHKDIYRQYYSVSRLRGLSRYNFLLEARYRDLWDGLVQTFRLFDTGGTGLQLSIKPLGGDLFDMDLIRDLAGARIGNDLLLACIRDLNEFEDATGHRTTVNYRALDVEELGSVYESLLDLHPVIDYVSQGDPARISFRFEEGTDRKTTGSYYTRPELVNELIQSALIPVIEERLKAARGKEDKSRALLGLKVCDPAAGSGHMLLAAARTIAWYLARIESGEDNPAPGVYRRCLREVIQHCIHAVDMNPDAVELCKLAFWLEGHNSGKPLSFLDHKIRVGNSLVGVTDLGVLSRPIPADAFKAVTGDVAAVCSSLRRQNSSDSRSAQATLFAEQGQELPLAAEAAERYGAGLDDMPQDTIEGVEAVRQRFEAVRTGQQNSLMGCHIWTSAFFKTYTALDDPGNPTSERLHQYVATPGRFGQLVVTCRGLAGKYSFFHWPLEFPEVFAQGGFDVMLGNPPWERIKLQEEEFFATRDAAIANAPNAAARKRMIKALANSNQELHAEYLDALHGADATGKFLRESGRYALTAVGDINTYSVFAESFLTMINPRGRAGFIVPTGIATDDGNKKYFGFIVENDRLISLYDFENRKAIFSDVHRSFKFSLLTLSGGRITGVQAKFGFFLSSVDEMNDHRRIFSLTREDFLRLNPNTRTCPIFRTRVDAELTTKIYKRVPILINEETGENPWGVSFMRMFDMSNDSHLFRTRPQLEAEGFELWGNRMRRGEEVWLPLYEAKMIWHYDHRFGSYAGVDSRTSTQTPTPTLEQYQDPGYQVMPWYWVSENSVNGIVSNKTLIGFRNVARATDERTGIFSLVPFCGVGNSMPIIRMDIGPTLKTVLCAGFSSIVFDYIIRQKIAGINFNFFYFEQLPFLSQHQMVDDKEILIRIISLFHELTYTSWDVKAIADDVWIEASDEAKLSIRDQWTLNQNQTGGNAWDPPQWCEIDPDGCPLPPFKWDEDRRAVLKAELDAIYAHLYGLTTKELRYILDPQDVYGEDFPGETFRVLKEKEIRQYGEYRTKRLVLEAWERFGYDN